LTSSHTSQHALAAMAFCGAMLSKGRTNPEDKTGRFNQTAVSPGGPTFMSSPFLSNRSHLEEGGVIPSMQGYDTSPNDDGFAAIGKPSAAFHAEPRRRSNIVEDGTGHVFNTSALSPYSPDWMQGQEAEGGRPPHFGKLGPHVIPTVETLLGNVGPEAHHPSFARKGSAREPRPGDWSRKKTQIRDDETGQLRNQSMVSRSAPDFMKSPFESQRPYFEHRGIDQKLRPRTAKPQASVHEGHRAGLAYAEGADHVWGQQGEGTPGKNKKMNVRHEETGELHGNTLVSARAPKFMHSPFEADRANLEAQDKVQAPRDMKGQKKVQTKGFMESSKKMLPKPVSPDVPEWWGAHEELIPSQALYASTKAAGTPCAIAYAPGGEDKHRAPPSCVSGSTAASGRLSRASGVSRPSGASRASEASRPSGASRASGSLRPSGASRASGASSRRSGSVSHASRRSKSKASRSSVASSYLYGSGSGSGSRAGTQASGGSYYSYGSGSRTERSSRASGSGSGSGSGAGGIRSSRAGGGGRGTPAPSSLGFKPPARR